MIARIHLRIALAALVGLAGWSSSMAADQCECRAGLMLCCPDDYCSKPLPCLVHPRTCCPDNYCAKPFPCLQSPECFCCDNYCPKPLPCLCWRLSAAEYSCGGNSRATCGAAA